MGVSELVELDQLALSQVVDQTFRRRISARDHGSLLAS
jgi:hypothetical protein